MTITYILAVIGWLPTVLNDPKEAKAVDVPFFAAIIDTQDDNVVCGGAIISRRHVLTTCNCTGWYIADVVNARFQKIAFELYEIHVGIDVQGMAQTSSVTGKVYKIKDVYSYSKCKFVWPTGYIYNIGAMEVTKPFKCTSEVQFAPPAPHFTNVESYIVEDLANLGRTCSVAGFSGYTNMVQGHKTQRLTRQTVELMGFLKCQLYEPWWLSENEKLTGVHIANSMHVCAKSFDQVVNSLCFLEEGDPVVCDGYLIGLVSFIDMKACEANFSKLGRPLVIARVDVAYDFYMLMAGVSCNCPSFYSVMLVLCAVLK